MSTSHLHKIYMYTCVIFVFSYHFYFLFPSHPQSQSQSEHVLVQQKTFAGWKRWQGDDDSILPQQILLPFNFFLIFFPEAAERERNMLSLLSHSDLRCFLVLLLQWGNKSQVDLFPVLGSVDSPCAGQCWLKLFLHIVSSCKVWMANGTLPDRVVATN